MGATLNELTPRGGENKVVAGCKMKGLGTHHERSSAFSPDLICSKNSQSSAQADFLLVMTSQVMCHIDGILSGALNVHVYDRNDF